MNNPKLNLYAIFLIASLAALGAARADERAVAISLANQFYAAISPGQDAASMRAKANVLLADDAEIVLEDLGATQTRDEFLESLDEWSDAIAGGSIAHKIEEANADHVAVSVCYNFGDNALTTREMITLTGEKISKSVQTKVADDCADF